jgi:hypothetical protein
VLASSLWAVISYRFMIAITTGRVPCPGQELARSGARQGRRAGKQAGSGLMRRLEERWRRHQQRGC